MVVISLKENECFMVVETILTRKPLLENACEINDYLASNYLTISKKIIDNMPDSTQRKSLINLYNVYIEKTKVNTPIYKRRTTKK